MTAYFYDWASKSYSSDMYLTLLSEENVATRRFAIKTV